MEDAPTGVEAQRLDPGPGPHTLRGLSWRTPCCQVKVKDPLHEVMHCAVYPAADSSLKARVLRVVFVPFAWGIWQATEEADCTDPCCRRLGATFDRAYGCGCGRDIFDYAAEGFTNCLSLRCYSLACEEHVLPGLSALRVAAQCAGGGS